MLPRWKRVTRFASLALSAWMLVMTLSACGGSTASKPQPTLAVTLQTYNGTGFSMHYPSNWQKSVSGDHVTFTALDGKDVLTIFADPDLSGEPDSSAVASQSISRFAGNLFTHAQAVTVPPTFITGKVTWIQLSETGVLTTADPGAQGNLFLLVTSYPPQSKNTVTYQIEYYGSASTFGQANVSFMQMLQSFSFTSSAA
jgi:hypothetical protein